MSITFDLFCLLALPAASKNNQALATAPEAWDCNTTPGSSRESDVPPFIDTMEEEGQDGEKHLDDKIKFSTQNTKDICSHNFYMT